MIWKPFFDAQGRASWPHGGIENVIISAYWSIQIFTQYGHVIRINMYYVHINIYIYICVCVLQRSCMHESRPTGAFGFILGLKVTTVASSLGLPWGKGRGSWGASWFVEGLVTSELSGRGGGEKQRKRNLLTKEHKTWAPVLPGWSLGESPFEVRTEELVAKVTHGLGPEDTLLRGSFGSVTMARREAKTRPSYCWKSGMILSQEC